MTTDLPEQMLTYFAQREKQRADRVAAFLDSLSNYERGLFCDGAVMGYVRGSMHPRGEEIPLNAEIIADIVGACFAHHDLYPTVNADLEAHRITVEYFVQCQQPDGTWEQASSIDDRPDFIERRRTNLQRRFPEARFRIAQRTTSVIVKTEQEDED